MGNQPLAITDLILCEVLQGIKSDAAFPWVLSEMRRFEIFDTGDAGLAMEAAQSYRMLRKRGFTVRKTIDCLIAVFCIRNGHSLLHRDRDFDAFEQELELSVVHP